MGNYKTFSLGYIGPHLDDEKHVIINVDTKEMIIRDPLTYKAVGLSEDEYKEFFRILKQILGPSPILYTSQETEILTEIGWKKYEDLRMEDKVATYDIKTKQIEFMNPDKISSHEYVGKMIHISNESTDQLVTPDHKVITVSHRAGIRFQDADMVALNGSIVIPCYNIVDGVKNTWCRNSKRVGSIEEVDYRGVLWDIKTKKGTIVTKRKKRTAITGDGC